MKSLKEKNKKFFQIFKKFEIKYLIFKSIVFNTAIKNKVKSDILKNTWFSLGKKSSFTKIQNRCIFTNNSSSVLKKFRLHRMALRLNASYGYINGLKKSSW